MVNMDVIAQRAAALRDRHSDQADPDRLKLLLSLIDLTTLEGTDTAGKVRALCAQAMRPGGDRSDLPSMAAVCVYPSLVRIAKKELVGSSVKVASVAGGFPAGQIPVQLKLAETRYAIEEGANEIDLVISRGKFLEDEFAYVHDEIAAVKAICGNARLKTIIETGELGSLDNVRQASDIAIKAGSDFIKTSTGKIAPAATLEVVLVMADAIRDHHAATGKKVGLKPSGGIRSCNDALPYLQLVEEELGSTWLDRELLRFGASSLATDVIGRLQTIRATRK